MTHSPWGTVWKPKSSPKALLPSTRAPTVTKHWSL